MVIVSSESFVDSSRGGIFERHVLCAQSPMYLTQSAAPSGSSRLEVMFQLMFAKTLILKLHYGDVVKLIVLIC